MSEQVEFPSEGVILRGLLLRPDPQAASPVVIMAHGTSATIRMVAHDYAEVFRRNGFAVLLYDHRNLGASDGEPRQEINPWIQCRGYVHAIDFVQTLDGIDRDRVGLWGDSYSGGEVMVVGAVDERVSAIVAQIPVCGREVPTLEPTRVNFDAIRATLLDGDVSGGPDVTVGPLPVVSPDQLGTPSLLEPIQAFRWFIEHGARHGTGWLNRVTRVVPDTPVPYNPALCAPFVTAPTLMMVAPTDEMTHADYGVARGLRAAARPQGVVRHRRGPLRSPVSPQPAVRRGQRHPDCLPPTVAVAVGRPDTPARPRLALSSHSVVSGEPNSG